MENLLRAILSQREAEEDNTQEEENNMFMTNLKEEFQKLCLRLESIENQLKHTYVMKEKDRLKVSIKNLKERIDDILDDYNKGEIQ